MADLRRKTWKDVSTELAPWSGRFSGSGRLKGSGWVGRLPSEPRNVISMLIQPQKTTKHDPKGRSSTPFQHSCQVLGHPARSLERKHWPGN